MEIEIAKNKIDQTLEALLQEGCLGHSLLFEASKYSLLSPGKRIRPLIALSVTELLGKNSAAAWVAAATLEMIHTYSLIHDDLPCMDDDDFRRGKPSLHKVYGDGVATLVGDFLLTYSFEVLAECDSLTMYQRLSLISTLAKAAGGQGMVAGQILDIQESKDLPKVCALKTACLFEASFVFGGILSEVNHPVLSQLKNFGHHFGLFFQAVDDLCDEPANERLFSSLDQKKEELIEMARSLPFDPTFFLRLIEQVALVS